MSKRTIKCQKCGISDTVKDELEFETVGEKRPVKKYYHKYCYQEHLKDKEFKAKEQVKKDALNETIKQIYGLKGQMPNGAWTMLEHLRNGEPIFGARQKNITKRYKEGYDYLLLKETFEYCSETIEYYNRVKDFNGFMGAFKYALSIIIDKIFIVEQRQIQREKQRKQIEAHIDKVNVEEQVFETNYKKPTKNADITDFLDD